MALMAQLGSIQREMRSMVSENQPQTNVNGTSRNTRNSASNVNRSSNSNVVSKVIPGRASVNTSVNSKVGTKMMSKVQVDEDDQGNMNMTVTMPVVNRTGNARNSMTFQPGSTVQRRTV